MNAEFLVTFFTMILTGYIVGACVCRINLLDPKNHKWSWSLFYILFVYFACSVLIEALKRTPTAYELAGLVAIALNLWMTKATWGAQPPVVTHKKNEPIRLDIVTNREREIISVNVEAGRDLGDALRTDEFPQLSRHTQRSVL